MNKVVLLGGQSKTTEYVANALHQANILSAILLENPPSKMKMLKRRVRLVGIFTVFGQLQFMLISRLFLKNKRRIRDLEVQYGLQGGLPENVPVHRITSVNSREARNLLTELAPALVVVNGTRIISERVLDCTAALFINTHVGITPQYRGVHGGYWALADGKGELFGTTVHYVDKGVDTGEVIVQRTGTPESRDNFVSYPTLQFGLIVNDLVDTAKKIIHGEHPAAKNDAKMPSRQYFHPTLPGYLWRRLTRGVK